MADRPILFSAPMVRALLAGTKTQTRRTLNPQPPTEPDWHIADRDEDQVLWMGRDGTHVQAPIRIAVGDRLYVREHWKTFVSLDAVAPRDLWIAGGPRGAGLLYLADNGSLSMTADGVRTFGSREGDIAAFGKHRQAMHMPRWASRITLTITDVRVERLQDISAEDAIAEGVVDTGRRDGAPYGHFTIRGVPGIVIEHEPEPVYAQLWEMINGEGSWRANPWVAAYTFTVQMGNIDQLEAA